MKITNLKLFLSLAIVVGIANVDTSAATKINVGANISAIGINANQKRLVTNKTESNLTIEAINVINAKDVNRYIVAASIPPTAAGLRIIESRVVVNDIDIQPSLPIIL